MEPIEQTRREVRSLLSTVSSKATRYRLREIEERLADVEREDTSVSLVSPDETPH